MIFRGKTPYSLAHRFKFSEKLVTLQNCTMELQQQQVTPKRWLIYQTVWYHIPWRSQSESRKLLGSRARQIILHVPNYYVNIENKYKLNHEGKCCCYRYSEKFSLHRRNKVCETSSRGNFISSRLIQHFRLTRLETPVSNMVPCMLTTWFFGWSVLSRYTLQYEWQSVIHARQVLK
jgi:hypothetical protein